MVGISPLQSRQQISIRLQNTPSTGICATMVGMGVPAREVSLQQVGLPVQLPLLRHPMDLTLKQSRSQTQGILPKITTQLQVYGPPRAYTTTPTFSMLNFMCKGLNSTPTPQIRSSMEEKYCRAPHTSRRWTIS